MVMEIIICECGREEIGVLRDVYLREDPRKDFDYVFTIAYTKIEYNQTNLEAKIIHRPGFRANHSEVESKTLIIPDYSEGTYLDKVLATQEGLLYLQTLFRTQDDAEDIKRTLKTLSDYNFDKIRVWTPNQESRKEFPERTVGLNFCRGEFHVDGDLSFSNNNNNF